MFFVAVYVFSRKMFWNKKLYPHKPKWMIFIIR